MAVSIDEKVVEMRFNNKQFEKGIQTSIDSLDKLNKATDFTASQKNVKNLQAEFNKFNLGNAVRAVEGFSMKISAMGVAGAEVVRRITDSAIDLGKRIAGVVAKPIELAKSGGISRALNIEQAKFQLKGLKVAWDDIEDDINYGVQDTAYGLDAAAKAASQLVASSVKVGPEMKAALRGISGVAAMTNSSYEDISNIFTTVAGNGKLMTMELRQLSSRGLNVAAELGKQLGKSEKEIREMVTKGQIDFKMFSTAMDNAFGKHAKDANKTFEGSMSNVKAALSKIGALFAGPLYNNMIKPLNAIREGLNVIRDTLTKPAAQFEKFTAKVAKFFTLLMSNENTLKAIGNYTAGLVNVFKFGYSIFKQVATAFMSIFPPKTVQQIRESSQRFLDLTKSLKLTGRQMEVIQSIARGVFAAFKIFGVVIKTIKTALVSLIKSPVGQFFVDLAMKISDFLVKLSEVLTGVEGASAGLVDMIKRVFSTVMPLTGSLAAAGDLIADVFGRITAKADELFQKLPEGLQYVLNAFNKTSDDIDSTISDSLAYKFISGLGKVFRVAATLIVTACHGIFKAFSSIMQIIGRDGGFGELIKDFFAAGLFKQIEKLVGAVRRTLNIASSFSGVLNATRTALMKYQKLLSARTLLSIAAAIGVLALSIMLLSRIPGDRVVSALVGIAGAAVILAASFKIITKSMSSGSMIDGLFVGPKLLALATSILIMATALKSLSDMDIGQVGTSLAGLAGAMAILVGAVKILSSGSKSVVRGSVQMVIMAEAIKVLANVMVSLSGLNWNQVGIGLASVAGLLLSISAFSLVMNKVKVRMTTAVAILLIVNAIRSLAEVMNTMADVPVDNMIKGLAAVGVLLGEIAITSLIIGKISTAGILDLSFAIGAVAKGMVILADVVKTLGDIDTPKLMNGVVALGAVMAELAGLSAVLSHNKGIFMDTVGIYIMSKALVTLSEVVKTFGDMNVPQLIKGLSSVGIMIAELSGALAIMSHQKHTLAASLAILNLSMSLKILSGTVVTFSKMSWEEIAKGLTTLAGAMISLTGAALLMRKGLPGAAAMTIMAAALLLLVPSLIAIGMMPTNDIVRAISAIAGVLGTLVVTAAFATPLAKGFAIITRALLSFAASMIGVGAGMFMFAASVDMLLSSKARMLSAQNDFLKIAVAAGKALVKFITEVVKGLAKAAKDISVAVVDIVKAIIKSLQESIPELVDQAYQMILKFIDALGKGAEKYLPRLIKAVGKLIRRVVKAFKEYFKEFDGLGKAAVAKVVGFAAMITLIFRSLANSISKIGNIKNIAGAIVMVAGFVAIAGALLMLSVQPWDSILAATVALDAVLIAFTKCMETVSKMNVNLGTVALFVAGTLALLGVAGALKLIANENWASLLSAAAALTLVFVAYSAVFKVVTSGIITMNDIAAIGIFALGTLALFPVVIALKMLASEDYKALIASAAALTTALIGYAGVFAVLSMIPVGAAIGAIANLGIAIGGLALILALLGAVKQIPGVEWLVKEGSEFANLLGEAIGGFVGSIVAGFGKALSSILPQIGSDLAAFWQNATPFFEGVKSVGKDTMSAVQSLAGALLTLTATELIQGIMEFFGADINFHGMGMQLADFADGMVLFAEKTANLNMEDVNKAAAAAKMLGEFAGSVPLKGGLLSDIMGDRDLDGFAESLPKLGEGLSEFAAETEDLNSEAVERAGNCAKMLVALAGDVPLTGGLFGLIAGDRDLAGFADTLPDLGEAIAEFADNVSGLDVKSATDAGTVADMLIALSGNIPLTGGLFGLIAGDRDLSGFADTLPGLGSGLKEFADNVKGIDVQAANDAGTIAKMLSALANDLPNEGGLVSWFTGDNTLEDFGEQLPELGLKLKEFSDNINGISTANMQSAAVTINSVVNMLKTINTGVNGASSLNVFASDLKLLGESYRDFCVAVNRDFSTVTTFNNGISMILKSIRKISKTDTSKIKTFTKDIKGLTNAGINNVTDAATKSMGGAVTAVGSKNQQFKAAGEVAIKQIANGMNAKSSLVKDAAKTTMENAASATQSDVEKSKYRKTGEFLIDGFIKGMSDNEKIKKVVDAAKKIAKAAKNGIDDELEIHSPSKKLFKSGGFTVDGFIKGITDKKNDVIKTGQDMANNFMSGTNNGLNSTNEFSFDSLLKAFGLSDDSTTKTKTEKKAKEKGKKVGKAVAEGAGSSEVTNEAKKSGGKIGSSVAEGAKFSKKELAAALESYKVIMGQYSKEYATYSQKFLNTALTKKGAGRLKVTAKYILSGINNKYIRTVAANLGTDLAKSINSAMNKELRSNDKTSGILENLDKAGKKLVDSRKRKKEAQAIINNSKSSKKAVSSARKELANANKDVEKYQKAVNKYEKQLKKAGSSIAKNLTQQSIGEITNGVAEFAAMFNSVDGKTGSFLIKMPTVVAEYLKNTETASKYAKEVVEAVGTTFGSNIATMDEATNKSINELESKLAKAKKQQREANKILKDKSSSSKEQKKAKKELAAAEKTIYNLNAKIANERKKLGANAVVETFAKRLYYNSDAYKEELNNIITATKKIKKIQKDAKTARDKMNKAKKAEDKKKYADELKDLKKQYKTEEKNLKKTTKNIKNGPKKAMKEYTASIKEALKSMLSITNLDITPKIQLSGFDKFEKTSNLVQEASVNSDIFAKAIATAGSKFSIFGDISKKTTQSFEFFNDAISTGINLLQRFTKVGSVEKQALFENADSQLEAYEEFYKGIEQLRAKGLSDTVVDDLKSQGPEALNYIRGFLSMGEDEIKAYNDRVGKMNAYGAANYANELRQSMKKAQMFSSSLNQLASLGVRSEIIEQFKEMGQESAQGYIDALLNDTADGINELNSLYDEYVSTSTRSMLEAAEEQYQASLSYSKMIDDIKKTALDPAIIKEIENMGQEEAMAYGRSILSNLNDIPRLNELYWKSQSNDKTMRQQMEEANKEAQAFAEGLQQLSNMGVHKDFVEYVKGLGVDEGTAVLQRAIREFGSLSDDLRAEEVQLFNEEYLKSKSSSGKTPVEVMLENLDSQNKGYDEYTDNLGKVLDKLGGDTKSEYFKYLKEMGMDGAEYVEALANATEDQIQRYRDMIDQREARNRKERAQAVIDSWNEQLDTIKNYTSNVAQLIQRGASQTLVDELASMDIKDAANKVEALLAMDQNSFSQWNDQYTQMMNQDVGKLVNELVANYAAAGNVTVEQAKKNAEDSVEATKQVIVDGSYKTADAQTQAYKEATLAKYPEMEETGKSAAQKTVDAFTSTIAQNIGSIPVTAVVQAFTEGLGNKKVAKKLVTSGEAITSGVMKGIRTKEAELISLANTVAVNVFTEFKSWLNKSRGQTVAKNMTNGIHTIMLSQEPVLVTDAYNIAKHMNDQFATYLNFEQGKYYAEQMGFGLRIGFEEAADKCMAAAERLIEAANRAAEAAAQIHSPSRVWRQYGLYMGEGLALGMEDFSGLVANAADNMVTDAGDAFADTLSMISDAVSDKLDLNPVITPELDLSRVMEQAGRINTMFNNAQIGATVKATNSNDETNQNGTVVYNFEQNNYSPKALSNLEIYRQTKNQFAMAKEALNR